MGVILHCVPSGDKDVVLDKKLCAVAGVDAVVQCVIVIVVDMSSSEALQQGLVWLSGVVVRGLAYE